MGVNGDFVVLYATPATAAELAGQPGYSLLAFRLARHVARRPPTEPSTTYARYLRANTSFTRLLRPAEHPRARQYPGKELFDQLASLMNVFTVLALLAAIVLVANTMATLIGEQRREIGMMKAIGGTRRQIRRVYLRTALLLGATAAVLGVGLGVVIANAIVGFFGSSFFAISPGCGVQRAGGRREPGARSRRPAARGAACDPPRHACPRARGARGSPVARRRRPNRRHGAPAASPSCRARRRSASAASPAARAAASRPSCRSRSRSGRCSACWRS